MIERIKRLFAKPAAKIDHMAAMREMARVAPLPNGSLHGRNVKEVFGAEICQVLILDSNGRAFCAKEIDITRAVFSEIYPARSNVIDLMDRLGTADIAYQPGAFQD